jgi:hypothetical protein
MRGDSSELAKFFWVETLCLIKTFFLSLLVSFFHPMSALSSPSPRDGLVKLMGFYWEKSPNSFFDSTRFPELNQRSETKENKKFFIMPLFSFFWWSSKLHQKNRVPETQRNHP